MNDRRGAEFSTAAGAIFAGEGWNVRTQVEMTELGAPTCRAMGDVDVLAWKGDVVCVCECKELLFARTIGEVVGQLVRFRGNPGDDLDKHLQRVKFLQESTMELRRITKIGIPRIVSILITSKVVPMQFVSDLGTQILAADELISGYLQGLLD